MEPYFTSEGNRPDLAAIEAVKPEGYIADQIFPVVPVADMSGTVYYATINADSAAQTNRVDGVAPSTTQIADSSTTYTAAERIKRYSITPKEAKQMGGIEKADMVGAKASKRSIFTSIEAEVAALVLKSAGDADDTFDAAKVHTVIQDAIDGIEQYEGMTSLITSTKTAKAMIQSLLADGTQGKVLARIVSGASPSAAITGLNFNAWVDALAMYLGVDKVLLGTSRIWNAGANAGRFAIARLDDGMDPLSHKYMPVLGKRFQYLQDGENPFSIETVADRVAKNNHYDAQVLDDVVVLNSGAIYVFDGVQDA
jgi:hypothetical protein